MHVRNELDNNNTVEGETSSAFEKLCYYIDDLEDYANNLDWQPKTPGTGASTSSASAATPEAPQASDPRDEVIRNMTGELASAQARLFAIGLLTR